VGTPPAQPERENLAGFVEHATFHNEENGFSVLRVKARGQRDLITVVGHTVHSILLLITARRAPARARRTR
jgi:hypothetical protein